MSKVRSDNISNRADDGAPKLVYGAEVPVGYGITGAGGINITGVATAASFSGPLTGNVTGNVTGNSTGLTGTPDITVRNITGVAATFTGLITYEDVTNIDSIGIITARSGIDVTGSVAGYDYLQAPFSSTVTLGVIVAGKDATHRYNGTGSGNGYKIDGVFAPYLTLSPGRTYKFNQADSSNNTHPIIFYLEADKQTEYTTGVTYYADGIKTTSAAYDTDFNAATDRYTQIVVSDSTPTVLHYQCYNHGYMGNAVNTNSNAVVSSETAIFRGGLAEKYENAGTTLGSQPNNPLSDGNVILFTGNESGNLTINFTGVHSTLSNGETVSFTAILTPNNSGKITAVQVDGQTPAGGLKWSGGSAPSAGSSGQDIYTFQILKTGTANTAYTVYGAAANYA